MKRSVPPIHNNKVKGFYIPKVEKRWISHSLNHFLPLFLLLFLHGSSAEIQCGLDQGTVPADSCGKPRYPQQGPHLGKVRRL